MMRMTFSAAMTLVLVSAASFYWSRQVEAANWYGATSSVSWCHGNMQDNGQMTYHRSGLSGGMWEAVATTLAYDVSPTDIDLQSEHLSSDVNTDVVYLESNYSGLRYLRNHELLLARNARCAKWLNGGDWLGEMPGVIRVALPAFQCVLRLIVDGWRLGCGSSASGLSRKRSHRRIEARR